jgi:hypothetical protein
MTQRRKKSTSFQKQKIAKAQHRNEFIRKLKIVINAINGKDGPVDLSQTLLEKLYNSRLHSFKVVVPDQCTVPSEIVNYTRQIISGWAKKEKVIVIPGKLEVTIEEFYTVVLTVSINLDRFLTDELSSLGPLKKKLRKFNIALENVYEKATNDIYTTLLTLEFYHTDIGKTIYWLNHEMDPTPGLASGIDNLIKYNTYKSESTSVVIDDKPRPVVRLGYSFPNYGIEWISIKPSVLNIDNSFADIPLDVYIQSHALLRLSERIDCYLTGSLHYNMFISFKDPKVSYDSNHNILIEYRYFGMKAGYFRLDIVEGKIIIRTFLFVTNNGTPEGIKLEHITGLKKLDKKYLALDKLSTFMTSDIGNNEKVRKIFISAGCQCLLDLYEKSHIIATNSPNHFDADLMLKYIEHDNEYRPESFKKTTLLSTQPEII